MQVRIYKFFSYLTSVFIFATVKVADAISDTCSWVRIFLKNLVNLWILIWKGFEISNFFKIIGLTFGSILISAKMATNEVKKTAEKRAIQAKENAFFGTTSTLYECALFRLNLAK